MCGLFPCIPILTILFIYKKVLRDERFKILRETNRLGSCNTHYLFYLFLYIFNNFLQLYNVLSFSLKSDFLIIFVASTLLIYKNGIISFNKTH